MTDRVLTLQQVAALTGRPLATHRYWRHLGIGPKTFKLGRRVVALEADVDRWIEEQRAADEHSGGTAAGPQTWGRPDDEPARRRTGPVRTRRSDQQAASPLPL